jgi:hypothetical protein
MSRRARKPIDRWERPADMAPGAGCYVLDCGRKVIAKGMCWNHYQRARRGNPVFVFLRSRTRTRVYEVEFGPPKPPYGVLRMARIARDLESNVTWEPTTGCALWLGEYNELVGRPVIGRQGDPWGRWAARAVLYFQGVALESGNRKMHARHLCDNGGACVNPRHIVYSTAKENMADRERRYARGELRRIPTPRKLAPALVEYVREAHALGASKAELARDLGVHWQTVDLAIRRAEAAVPHLEQRAA